MPQQKGNRGSKNDLFAPPSPEELESAKLFAPPSEDELAKYSSGTRSANIPDEDRGLGQTILEDYVAPVGKFIDTYTGAPTRAGINEVVEGRGLLSGVSKFGEQFGEDPAKAPTGKEIAIKLGADNSTELSSKLPSLYSDTGDEWLKFKRHGMLDPTEAGAAGLGIDIAADPTNFIPVGAIAKGAGQVAVKGVETAGRVGKTLVGGLLKGGALAADLASGTKAGTRALETGARIGERLGGVADRLAEVVKLDQSADLSKWAGVAAKHGIDPEILPSAIKYGERSPITRIEKAAGYGVSGKDIMDKSDSAFRAVDDALDNKIFETGGMVSIPDKAAVGNVISEGFEKAKGRLFDQSAVRYSNLYKLNPELTLSERAMKAFEAKVAGIEKRARGMLERGATGEQVAQAQDLLESLERIRKSGGNVKQLSEQIGYVGQAAFAPNSTFKKLAPDQKGLQELYHGMKDAFETTADDLAPAVGKQLKESNKAITEFIENAQPIIKQIENKSLAPEKLVDALTKDSKKAQSLVNMLEPSELNQVKAAVLESLIKRNAEEGVQYGMSLKNLRSNASKLNVFFSKEELKSVEELLELGQKMGDRFPKGVPQTGVIQGLIDLPKKAVSAVADREVIDYLKQIADKKRVPGLLQQAAETGAEIAPKATENFTEAAVQVPSKKDMLNGLLNLQKKRSRAGGLLKGAQSIAPSEYEYSEQ